MIASPQKLNFPAASPSERPDYLERVYAGVLGKVIGVYIGQPLEGWSNERIEKEFGEIAWYVNEKLGKPLVVSDDDIAGTFTFIRAMDDHRVGRDITSEQIGWTWLNYLIEYENTLAWGGLGRFTEHTAFLRLQAGIRAPESGSIETNGRWLAEQIGAQIFVDGWAMMAPGDPDLAVELAGRAARVSHDGVAVHAAQAVAAMESLAFVEPDMDRLFDCAQNCLPCDSVIRALHQDVRQWAADHGDDWRRTFGLIKQKYTRRKFAGIVPEHAVMVMAWAHAPDSFARALMISGTAGGDTDCNMGNVGCLMGIKQGIAGLTAADGRDWRAPFADRMLLPPATGTSDALRIADSLVCSGRRVMGWKDIPGPKDGARLHFSMPGAQHGFLSENSDRLRVANVDAGAGVRRLRLSLLRASGNGSTPSTSSGQEAITPDLPAVASTPTWVTPDRLPVFRDCYGAAKYPTLFSGQKLSASLHAGRGNTEPLKVSIVIRYYTDLGSDTKTAQLNSEPLTLVPGTSGRIEWTVPDTGGLPIYDLGVALDGVAPGAVDLDRLDWSGSPRIAFPPALYRTDYGYPYGWTISGKPYRHMIPNNEATVVVGNRGLSILSTGLATPDWRDYAVSAELLVCTADSAGILARYGGLKRYLGLEYRWRDKKLRLVRQYDGKRRALASVGCVWEINERHVLRLEVRGQTVIAFADGKEMFRCRFRGLAVGGIGLFAEVGSGQFSHVSVCDG